MSFLFLTVDAFFQLIYVLFFMCMNQKMDRARSYESGMFKKPGDFLQMFKVTVSSLLSKTFLILCGYCL
jgi:hypothetical protein